MRQLIILPNLQSFATGILQLLQKCYRDAISRSNDNTPGKIMAETDPNTAIEWGKHVH